MTYKFSLRNNCIADDNSFAWQRNLTALPTPPVLSDIKGKLYRLSNFNSENNEYLVTESADFAEGLDLSINLYSGKISLVELGNIYKICTVFDIDIKNMNIFKTYGIKGSKSFETLKLLPALPKSLLKYIEEKNVPLKSLSILVGLNANQIKFISDYIEVKDPSLQNFKKFMEATADFKEATAFVEYSENWNFPQVKSGERIIIEKYLENIQRKIAPIRANSIDSFESGKINFSMEICDFQEYESSIRSLDNLKPDIKNFFELLKIHDIR